MIIQHNIMALNSHNRLGANNTQVSKNLEKLSSGYKINRAGDDAAGLAISEKMRAQITGLERAQQNAQDGISLVQTAEGQLTEVHSMLNRMVDLATQSSNGTIDNDVDRANLQKEITALKDEIDRIAENANFNGIKLLNGNLGSGATAKAPTVADVTIAGTDVTADKNNASAYERSLSDATAIDTGTDKIKVSYKDADGVTQEVEIGLTGGTQTASGVVTELKKNTALTALFEITADTNGVKFTAKTTGAANKATLEGITENKGGATFTALTIGTATAGKDAYESFDLSGTLATGDAITVNGKTYTYAATPAADSKTEFDDLDALKTLLAADGVEADITTTSAVTFATKAGAGAANTGLSLQIGDSAAQRISVKVDSMSTASLGIDTVDVGTETGATAAMDAIKAAINTVSGTRADLGAIQNRLEHTINNLSTTTENMTAAESRIRDTDMAKEMMQFTKNNVLAQAAQAMLAQANQQPQQVLQLLR